MNRELAIDLGHKVYDALELALKMSEEMAGTHHNVEFAAEVVAPLTSALNYLHAITHIGDN